MFTGIIEQLAMVLSFDGGRLVIDPMQPVTNPQLGESIALNGVCLTVVGGLDGELQFDLSPETIERSNFSSIKPGDFLNLERAMALGDRLGGHIVQGHVDEVGTLVSISPAEGSMVFRFRVNQPRYIIQKGSVTLNGISLTVVNPQENEFDCWIIPHTLENTNLSKAAPDDPVNVEYDPIAKYVERLTLPYSEKLAR